MARTITFVAVVAMLALGTTAALTVGAGPQATPDATMAQQETTTTPVGETTTPDNETANVTFYEQTAELNNTTLIVQRAVLPEGGFIVIHNATPATEGTTTTVEDGEMVTETPVEDGETTTVMDDEQTPQFEAGEVISNSTYLEPGVHEDVAINVTEELEADPGETKTLIAMLHRDTNDNQEYDFPEADAPYVTDGQPVIDWANVTISGPTR